MNYMFKSYYIFLLPGLCFIVFVYQLERLWSVGFDNVWRLGELLPSLAVLLFFAFLYLIRRPRTDRYLRVYSVGITLGVIWSLWIRFRGIINYDFIILNIGVLFGWAGYLFWYSKFKDRNLNSALKLGLKLPKLKLKDVHGRIYSPKEFEGKYAIYIFYRGIWCPLCYAQVKEISAHYKELESNGTQTILISPQPHSKSEKLANKFDVGFNYIVDVGNIVAKRLGIWAKRGTPIGFVALGYDPDTVLPTVIITSPSGKIIFTDLTDNYRIRPEPSSFIKIIEKHRSSG